MKQRTIILVTLLLLIVRSDLQSQQKEKNQLSETSVSWVKRIQQGYGMKLWMSNDLVLGKAAWHGAPPPSTECNGNSIGCEFPVGTCIEHLYGAGPFIGGKINGVRYVSTAYDGSNGRTEFNLAPKDSFRNRFWESSRNDSSYDSSRIGYYKYGMNKRCVDDDNDGKLDEDDLDGEDNDGDWNVAFDDLGTDGLPDSLEKGCKGMYDPVKNSDPAFDNFFAGNYDSCLFRVIRSRDLYTQNNRKPDHGEPHVDEDFSAFSDQDIYCSATDTVVTDVKHTPMGVKIIQKSFVWNLSNLENAVAFEYTFVNIGQNSINDIYLGMFADMDVGSLNGFQYRNYAGYFEAERLGYIHNPVEQGATPLGISIIEAPKPWDSLKTIFRYFQFDSPCGVSDNTDNYYCISCADEFDEHCIFTEPPSNSLVDTRFVLSVGPIKEFLPGDTLGLTIVLLADESVNSLRYAAHSFMSRGTEDPLPLDPPPPPLKIEKENNSVILKWGCSANLTKPCYSDTFFTQKPCGILPGHTFEPRMVIREGYRIYRSSSENYDSNSFTLIAQYDKIDSFHIGWETGIETTFVDNTVSTGKYYWYAVTAFSRPEFVIINIPGPGGSIIKDTVWNYSTESPLSANATKVYMSFAPSAKLGEVLVVPNPYRGDVEYVNGDGYEGTSSAWTPYKRIVRFIHLPSKATIRIYSLVGDVITTIYHDETTGSVEGQYDFPLFSESGRPLANGIYPYTVESEYGRQIGKFVIAR